MSEAPEPVALALGSNAGERTVTLAAAARRLAERLGRARLSPLYRSRPLSPIEQPDFLNVVLVGRSAEGPETLLALGKALERAAGRAPGPRFGPRPLDVDLLLYGDRVLQNPELTLPHPRLRRRRFYLEPLAALAPGRRVPPDGATVAEILAALDEPQEVELVGSLVLHPDTRFARVGPAC